MYDTRTTNDSYNLVVHLLKVSIWLSTYLAMTGLFVGCLWYSVGMVSSGVMYIQPGMYVGMLIYLLFATAVYIGVFSMYLGIAIGIVTSKQLHQP